MYALELAFSDDPARLEARPAHRERLSALAEQGRLLVAGPFADDSGALIIFLADSEAEAQELVDADPYYRAPGVQVRSLREWNGVTRHPALAAL